MKEQFKEASKHTAKFISKYPNKVVEITSLLVLLESKILEGSSPDNELNHFINDLKELEKEIVYGKD
jgi:hypothetical protein